MSAPPSSTYQYEEGVEVLEGYEPGGYHPTHIGDRHLDGRYEIVHKLGHGGYSTVWLTRDHKLSRYVALKILVASSSEDCSESKILRILAAGNADHPGRNEVAGCSIADSKEASITCMFPADVARAISAQLLLGLDYIHSCGVVHGDLHLNNILFASSSLDTMTIEELYQRVGVPQRLPVQRLDQAPNGPEVPQYSVPPAIIAKSSEHILDARILISDFGESFTLNDKHEDLHTPILLLPPESVFHEKLGQAIDVWILGCTLYEILGERPLFEGFIPDEDHVIAEMISTLGNIPQRWWNQWEKRTDFFLEDGSWKKDTHRIHAPYSRPMTERLCIMGRGSDPDTCEFSSKEMSALERLLRAMMTYEPSERITTSAALRSEWMRDWGRPAMTKVGISLSTEE
ncbi:protein kinase [Aspergillus ellipticus CBS 707.79]|uniref:Protein kinase n=1 Tax=Aspergillus ellipticus CBS 707.79 TaxID=1448320 RepID=A0A319D4C0_9EURO|nr:protein kinase [Aspergillus ellipticus CBS 707.79]